VINLNDKQKDREIRINQALLHNLYFQKFAIEEMKSRVVRQFSYYCILCAVIIHYGMAHAIFIKFPGSFTVIYQFIFSKTPSSTENIYSKPPVHGYCIKGSNTPSAIFHLNTII